MGEGCIFAIIIIALTPARSVRIQRDGFAPNASEAAVGRHSDGVDSVGRSALDNSPKWVSSVTASGEGIGTMTTPSLAP